jgi:Restriction Endonuclease associating with ARP
MTLATGEFAGGLREEICARNRELARGRAHVESYGEMPAVVYAPEDGRHGNFMDASYAAICARANWMRRFDKVHTGARGLPKAKRKWRELDSCVSSDALLMNVFCHPATLKRAEVRGMLGLQPDLEAEAEPEFGWRARVPLKNGRVDRTEVDMRLGDLLVEAKLTEADFQVREARVMEAYRDFDAVFERELLPRVAMRKPRRRGAVEFPEAFTQEWEDAAEDDAAARDFQAEIAARAREEEPFEEGFAGYQLIRNVLAAEATGMRFCVVHDARRPDLREQWFEVMAAVRQAELRVRLMVLTWQELAAELGEEAQEFLEVKYGIC